MWKFVFWTNVTFYLYAYNRIFKVRRCRVDTMLIILSNCIIVFDRCYIRRRYIVWYYYWYDKNFNCCVFMGLNSSRRSSTMRRLVCLVSSVFVNHFNKGEGESNNSPEPYAMWNICTLHQSFHWWWCRLGFFKLKYSLQLFYKMTCYCFTCYTFFTLGNVVKGTYQLPVPLPIRTIWRNNITKNIGMNG